MATHQRRPYGVEAYQWQMLDRTDEPDWVKALISNSRLYATFDNGGGLGAVLRDAGYPAVKVEDGDWIIKHGNKLKVMSDKDFKLDYEPLP